MFFGGTLLDGGRGRVFIGADVGMQIYVDVGRLFLLVTMFVHNLTIKRVIIIIITSHPVPSDKIREHEW